VHLKPVQVQASSLLFEATPINKCAQDWACLIRWGICLRRALEISRAQSAGRHVRARKKEGVLDDLCDSMDDLNIKDRWQMHGIIESSPMCMLSDELLYAVHFMCLLRVRVAPFVPPEIWETVVLRVLTPHGFTDSCCRRFGYSNHAMKLAGANIRSLAFHYPFCMMRVELEPPVLPQLSAIDLSGLSHILNKEDATRLTQAVRQFYTLSDELAPALRE